MVEQTTIASSPASSIFFITINNLSVTLPVNVTKSPSTNFNLLFCVAIFVMNFYSEIQLLLVLKFFVLSGSLVYSLVTLNKLVPIFSYFKKERK